MSASPADPTRLAKRELRAHCRRLRDDLGEEYRSKASQRIVSTLARWSPLLSARLVLTYLPMPGEIDLQPLMGLLPDVRWAIPRIAAEPVRRLAFHLYQPDRLTRHRYGMLEPDPALPEISADEANLIIIPALCYTRRGYRLGYGGGYYDRLLAASGPTPTVGVCFEALLLEDLPRAAHDLPVSHVVTEVQGVIDCQVEDQHTG